MNFTVNLGKTSNGEFWQGRCFIKHESVYLPKKNKSYNNIYSKLRKIIELSFLFRKNCNFKAITLKCYFTEVFNNAYSHMMRIPFIIQIGC